MSEIKILPYQQACEYISAAASIGEGFRIQYPNTVLDQRIIAGSSKIPSSLYDFISPFSPYIRSTRRQGAHEFWRSQDEIHEAVALDPQDLESAAGVLLVRENVSIFNANIIGGSHRDSKPVISNAYYLDAWAQSPSKITELYLYGASWVDEYHQSKSENRPVICTAIGQLSVKKSVQKNKRPAASGLLKNLPKMLPNLNSLPEDDKKIEIYGEFEKSLGNVLPHKLIGNIIVGGSGQRKAKPGVVVYI